MPRDRRIIWTGVWSSRFTNARYYELLSRLDSIQQVRFPFVRGAHRLYLPAQRALLRLASRRFGMHFCTHLPLLAAFQGPAIVDIDDPRLTPEELTALRHPRVRVIVTTTETLRHRLEAALRSPVVVIPSGYGRRDIDPARVEVIRRACNPGGVPVIGYVSFQLSYGSGNHYSDVDILLHAMPAVWERHPQVEVWLLGLSDPGLRGFTAREPRVKCWGLVPHTDVLNWISNFTVATYCRQYDSGGWFRIKLIEYMGCGIPIVSTAVSEAAVVAEAGAGVLAGDVTAFAASLTRLLDDPSRRSRLGRTGLAFAAPYDWDRIATRYQTEVLNFYAAVT